MVYIDIWSKCGYSEFKVEKRNLTSHICISILEIWLKDVQIEVY